MSRKLYTYGMRLRGFAPMAQPLDGLSKWHDDESGKYYTILYYKRKLADKEVADYELDYIDEVWSQECAGTIYKGE